MVFLMLLNLIIVVALLLVYQYQKFLMFVMHIPKLDYTLSMHLRTGLQLVLLEELVEIIFGQEAQLPTQLSLVVITLTHTYQDKLQVITVL